MRVALFDFDGTITNKDSMFEFIKFAVGKPKFYSKFVLIMPILVLYKLKVIHNYQAKEYLLSLYFKNWTQTRFKDLADQYSSTKIHEIIRPKALEEIRWHQSQEHNVVIVSASIECWLAEWCRSNAVQLIATKLEIKDAKLTGKLFTKNCFGAEKVVRIKEKLTLSDFSLIYAYGDSSGDKEMLSIADKQYYKYFE